MKTYIIFIIGFMVGWWFAALQVWISAESIVAKKQTMIKKLVEARKILLGIYKRQRKRFISPQEAAFVPEDEIIYQYPSKAQLADKPGKEAEPIYDRCFNRYVVNGKMTKAEAFRQAMEDYPNEIQLGDEEAFREAMRRREIKLTKP